jgi:hypothetical protein
MVAARCREYYDKQAKERQKARRGGQPGAEVETLPPLEKSKARDEAGKDFGISGSMWSAKSPNDNEQRNPHPSPDFSCAFC